jgi:PAS domain S-box-containing protein
VDNSLFLNSTHPDDRKMVDEAVQRAIAYHTPLSVDCRIIRPDGDVRFIHSEGEVVFDDQGHPIQFFGTDQDITDRKQVEEALRESEDKYRTLVEKSGDGIIITDEAGRITTWNKGMEIITGLAANDVLGAPAWEIQSRVVDEDWAGPDYRTRYRAAWDRVLRDGTYQHANRLLDIQARTRMGAIRHLQQSLFAIRTSRGYRVGGIIRDITDRKLAEETLRERERILESIFRAAPVGIGLVSNRVIVQVNDRLCQMTGYAREELVGQDARIVYPSDEEYAFVGREKYARILKNGLGAVETRWRRKDGTVFDVLLSSSPVDPSSPYDNVSFIALDITKLRENEKALKDNAERLKRSNEDLERFAYVASHDLQEPLRNVISFTQLLERRYKGQMGAEADEYIRFTVDAGKRMQTLITDLLEFSRVATRGSAMSLVDAERILAEVLANLQTRIEESGAVITCDSLPRVKADPSQLMQVFQNLIANAIAFHNEGVPPRIHIAAETSNGMVQFSVADNGIGIEPQYFERIFVIFQRLHGRERYPGTGIGLALCKRIIERHGGRIWVESEPGKGSTFFFTLPAIPTAAR